MGPIAQPMTGLFAMPAGLGWKRMEKSLFEVLATLTDLEREVLLLHYGLNGRECSSFEEIGELLGITPERAADIDQQAMARGRSFLLKQGRDDRE